MGTLVSDEPVVVTARLAGWVGREDGLPIPGIQVSAYCVQEGQWAVATSGMSGADGQFSLSSEAFRRCGTSPFRLQFFDPAERYRGSFFPGASTLETAGNIRLDPRAAADAGSLSVVLEESAPPRAAVEIGGTEARAAQASSGIAAMSIGVAPVQPPVAQDRHAGAGTVTAAGAAVTVDQATGLTSICRYRSGMSSATITVTTQILCNVDKYSVALVSRSTSATGSMPSKKICPTEDDDPSPCKTTVTKSKGSAYVTWVLPYDQLQNGRLEAQYVCLSGASSNVESDSDGPAATPVAAHLPYHIADVVVCDPSGRLTIATGAGMGGAKIALHRIPLTSGAQRQCMTSDNLPTPTPTAASGWAAPWDWYTDYSPAAATPTPIAIATTDSGGNYSFTDDPGYCYYVVVTPNQYCGGQLRFVSPLIGYEAASSPAIAGLDYRCPP